jgi:hypothetical protein
MKNLRGLGVVLSVGLVLFLFFLNLGAFAQSQSESQQDTSAESAYPAASENAPATDERSISVPEDYVNPNYQPAPANAADQQASPTAAPVLGHPLDPNDVATLTGKNDQHRQLGLNGGYYYPYSTDWFGVPQFGTPQFGTQFFSGPGSRFGNAFGGFGRGRNFGPNSFFFGPGPGTSFFLGGPHFAAPGMVFAPGRNWSFRAPPHAAATGSRFGRHHQP